MAVVTETISLEKEKTVTPQITRFDIHQIIQHAGLMLSFIILVATGLPLKYNTWSINQWWIGVWGGLDSTRTAHHLAAYLMVLVCIYHVVYLWYTISVQKKPFPIRMIPSGQDFVVFLQELLYFAGLRKEKPKFDRFNWREKFDYWAIFWGMPVMVGSGFILMYPVLVTRFLPGWIVPAALVAHGHEATLALSWIFLVHIFFNHFSPGVFPLNRSIFTGKLSHERYRRDHALEYERLTKVDRKEPQGEIPA